MLSYTINIFKLIIKIIIWCVFIGSLYYLLKLSNNDKVIKYGSIGIVFLVIYSLFSTKSNDLYTQLENNKIKKKSYNSFETVFITKNDKLYIYNILTNSIEKLDLLPADIILCYAANIGSTLITSTTGSNFSHVAMYTGYTIDEDEYKNRLKEHKLVINNKIDIKKCKSKINIPLDFKVVNLITMEADNYRKDESKSGVNLNKLSAKFFDYKIGLHTKHISFIRIKNINLKKRNEIIDIAYKKIGGNYSYNTIFSSAIAVLSTSECNFLNLLRNITLINTFYYGFEESNKLLNKCYENSYNNIQKTNNDYICSELIAYAYYESGVKLFNNLNLDKGNYEICQPLHFSKLINTNKDCKYLLSIEVTHNLDSSFNKDIYLKKIYCNFYKNNKIKIKECDIYNSLNMVIDKGLCFEYKNNKCFDNDGTGFTLEECKNKINYDYKDKINNENLLKIFKKNIYNCDYELNNCDSLDKVNCDKNDNCEFTNNKCKKKLNNNNIDEECSINYPFKLLINNKDKCFKNKECAKGIKSNCDFDRIKNNNLEIKLEYCDKYNDKNNDKSIVKNKQECLNDELCDIDENKCVKYNEEDLGYCIDKLIPICHDSVKKGTPLEKSSCYGLENNKNLIKSDFKKLFGKDKKCSDIIKKKLDEVCEINYECESGYCDNICKKNSFEEKYGSFTDYNRYNFEDSCSNFGSEFINLKKKECKMYAIFNKKTFAESIPDSWRNWPKGCFKYNDILYFSENGNGYDNKEASCYEKSPCICKKSVQIKGACFDGIDGVCNNDILGFKCKTRDKNKNYNEQEFNKVFFKDKKCGSCTDSKVDDNCGACLDSIDGSCWDNILEGKSISKNSGCRSWIKNKNLNDNDFNKVFFKGRKCNELKQTKKPTITPEKSTEKPKIFKKFQCKDGKNGDFYIIQKNDINNTNSNFNNDKYSPWDEQEAKRFCFSWRANQGLENEEGIFLPYI